MWKVIENPMDIKNYPVGAKVRVNGIETEISYHYSNSDCGFKTIKPIFPWDVNCGDGLFGNVDWGGKNTIEVWEE